MLKRFFSQPLNNQQLFFYFFGITLVLYIFQWTSGFYMDDFMSLSLLEHKALGYQFGDNFFDFQFWQNPVYQHYWWLDKTANAHFFRPIFSFLFASFYQIFGRNSAIPLHLLVLFVHSWASVGMYRLWDKFTQNRVWAMLATVLWVFSEDNVVALSWIASATDGLAVCAANWSFLFFLDWREKHNKTTLCYSLFFLIFALCSKESAVILPILILLYEWIFCEEAVLFSPKKFTAFFQRFTTWGYFLLLLILFLVAYKLGGYGTNSLFYRNPFTQFPEYLAALSIGFPAMFAAFFGLFPITGMMTQNETAAFVAGLGGLLLGLLLYFLLPYRKNKILIFSFLAFCFILLPQLSTFASERLLYYPNVFGSGLIAFWILQSKRISIWLGAEPDQTAPRKMRLWATYCAVMGLGLAPLATFVISGIYRYALAAPYRYTENLKQQLPPDAQKIVILNTPGVHFALYVGDMLRYMEQSEYRDISLLASFNGMQRIEFENDSTVIISTDKKGWLDGAYNRVFRTQSQVEKGTRIEKKYYTATILATTPDNTDVLKMRFQFRQSLKSADMTVLYFDGNAFQRLTAATIQAGESFDIDLSDANKYSIGTIETGKRSRLEID